MAAVLFWSLWGAAFFVLAGLVEWIYNLYVW